MANWTNARLVVVGRRADVLAFSKSARRSLEYFPREMRVSEGGELSSGRIRSPSGSKLSEKTYSFQFARVDPMAQFRRVSRRHERCWFIVAYSDPCWPESNTSLIRAGRCESFSMPAEVQAHFCGRVGFNPGSERFRDDLCWQAEDAIMDDCVERWRRKIPGWRK